MDYFKCTVCGYIHEGEEPPPRCPVCNAPREKFVELDPGEGAEAYEAYKEKMAARWDDIMAKLSEIERDDTLPSAGTLRPAQVERDDDAPERQTSGRSGLLGFVFSQMAKNHAHPMSVHVPNGVLPMAMLFLFLSVILDITCMHEAAFYSLVFVVLTMPAVMFSGYVDWQVRMGGSATRVIVTKIICGAAVTVIGIGLIIWQLIDPGVADPASVTRWTYFLVHLLMLAVAAYAGYLGGRLVFND